MESRFWKYYAPLLEKKMFLDFRGAYLLCVSRQCEGMSFLFTIYHMRGFVDVCLSSLNLNLMEDYPSRQHKRQWSSSTTRMTGSRGRHPSPEHCLQSPAGCSPFFTLWCPFNKTNPHFLDVRMNCSSCHSQPIKMIISVISLEGGKACFTESWKANDHCFPHFHKNTNHQEQTKR